MTAEILELHRGRRGRRPGASADTNVAKRRREDRQADAGRLRTMLSETSRLRVSDRVTLVRNLGRLIQRKWPENSKRRGVELFHAAFGAEAGHSMEKKRKRYFRFDGEPLPDRPDTGEYNARGATFLQLSDAFAILSHGGAASPEQKSETLLRLCEGASFHEPSRPRVDPDASREVQDIFREKIAIMLDKMGRETDVISYLDQIRNFAVRIHPCSRDDVSESVRNGLTERCLPVERFEHGSGRQGPLSGFERIELNGFGYREPSRLLPGFRMARVYCPRPVLCLEAAVPAKTIHDIRTRPLRRSELREALSDLNPSFTSNMTESEVEEVASRNWRKARERALRHAAMRNAGFDAETIDWQALEGPHDRAAIKGAEWRVFYEAKSIDIHLTADQEPEALALGLTLCSDWWGSAAKDLLKPADDVNPGREIDNCRFNDDAGGFFAWMPDGEMMRVCRGFLMEIPLPEDHDDPLDYREIEFDEDPFIDPFLALFEEQFLQIDQGDGWGLAQHAMKDPESDYPRTGSQRYPAVPRTPSLRPLFSAPEGWSPAPDGSLASAMLRSLAFGQGRERLDQKLLYAINERVDCFHQMKVDLSRKFEAGLEIHGYSSPNK